MRGFRAAASLTLVTAFIGAAPGHSAAEVGLPPAAPASCSDKIAEFQSWVAKIPSGDGVLRMHETEAGAPPDPNLVVSDASSFEPNGASPSVDMLRRVIRVVGDGTKVDSVAELRPVLGDVAKKKSDAGGPLPPLLLDIDRDRRWSEIVDVVNAAAEAGFAQVDFVFQSSVKIAPPPSAEDKESRRILAEPPYEHGRLALMEIDRILQKCPGGRKVLGHMAADPNKMKVLADEMPAALRACDCATNPRDLMTLFWTAADPDADGAIHREFIGARVTIAKGKQPATKIKATKTARWADTSAKVVAASKAAAPPVVRFESSGR